MRRNLLDDTGFLKYPFSLPFNPKRKTKEG